MKPQLAKMFRDFWVREIRERVDWFRDKGWGGCTWALGFKSKQNLKI